MYATGRAGVLDEEKARVYFELAAKQNDAQAETALGRMYYQGRGGNKDYDKAQSLFESAAKKKSLSGSNWAWNNI